MRSSTGKAGRPSQASFSGIGQCTTLAHIDPREANPSSMFDDQRVDSARLARELDHGVTWIVRGEWFRTKESWKPYRNSARTKYLRGVPEGKHTRDNFMTSWLQLAEREEGMPVKEEGSPASRQRESKPEFRGVSEREMLIWRKE